VPDEFASNSDVKSSRSVPRPAAPVDPALQCPRFAGLATLESAPMASSTDEPAEVAEPEHSPLDPETRARRDAALRLVRKHGDPVLRSRALRVDSFDEGLREQVRRMGQLMHEALGIGLAATQVGLMNRVLVYRVEADGAIAALVNPVQEWAGEERETMEEGCLSLPGVLVEVERPVYVRVRAEDERGEQIAIEASGLEARVIQHEMDHLDGVLILDRTSREQRKEAMRTLRETAPAPLGASA
jgi:peptide deformylase